MIRPVIPAQAATDKSWMRDRIRHDKAGVAVLRYYSGKAMVGIVIFYGKGLMFLKPAFPVDTGDHFEMNAKKIRLTTLSRTSG